MEKLLATMLLTIMPLTVSATEEQEAIENASLAAYKQSGMEKNVDVLIKTHVPKELMHVASQVSPIISVIVTQKVEFKWTF